MNNNAQFKNTLETILSVQLEGYSGTTFEIICLKLIEKALQGDLKTINFIRDTIGQQPFKELILNEVKIYSSDSELKEALFDKCLQRYGRERIENFVYKGYSLTSLEDLAKQLMNDNAEEETI